MLEAYFPILIYLLVAVGFAGLSVLISTFTGPRKEGNIQKWMPYECGNPDILPFNSRFSVKFYVTAMLFILFDIEVVFFFPWAVVFRQLGWSGFVELLIFIFVLLFGYCYAWKQGAFEWN